MANKSYILLGFLIVQGLGCALSQSVDVTANQRVVKGQRVSITCRITSRNLQYDVRWSLGDQLITNNTIVTFKERSNRYQVIHQSIGIWELVIHSARLDDSGKWRCTKMSSKPPISDSMELSVNGPGVAPVIKWITPTQNVKVGDYVRLECNATGDPYPTIMWYSPSRQVLPTNIISFTGEVYQFVVDRVDIIDIITCFAKNTIGNMSKTVRINVLSKPFLRSKESSRFLIPTWALLNTTLTCKFGGHPKVTITWLRWNGTLFESVPIKSTQILSISTITVPVKTVTDFTRYQCRAENQLGVAQHTMRLVPGDTPSEPILEEVETTLTTIRLLFDPPKSDGGLGITYYRIEYRIVDEGETKYKDVKPPAKVLELRNLQPKKPYRVRIAAGNVAGTGNFSIERTAFTSRGGPKLPTAPAATLDPDKHNDRTTLALKIAIPIVGVFMALAFAVLMVLAIIAIRKRKWRVLEEEQLYRFHTGSSSVESIPSLLKTISRAYVDVNIPSMQFKNLTCGKRRNFEFSRDKLKLGRTIGNGSFGKVVKAEAKDLIRPGYVTTVAVKMLKENATEVDRQDLLKELRVMKLLDVHPNIVVLLGCCTDRDPIYVIMDFLPNGNLLGHLRSSRQKVESSNRTSMKTYLSPTDLLRYAYEVANGMAYLASMKCIHRDLAARNILLSCDCVCKLADFGLARDVINGGVYQRKSQGRVPIRWMALESLIDNVYTIQSDVWSFGVLLWEIITIGSYPYPGMSSKRLISDLQKGFRMPRPDHANDDVYQIMLECWNTSPELRPSFLELKRKLEIMLSECREYIVLDELEELVYDYALIGSNDIAKEIFPEVAENDLATTRKTGRSLRTERTPSGKIQTPFDFPL
ncbi:fibroblast growth factor receptor 2-like [Antedon mediterranea]|uniref:fibroblast growth factor receptor 2-like n=1 Tax=Antedon mediterranea TaxID=105859 RepID=UPI003AF6344B